MAFSEAARGCLPYWIRQYNKKEMRYGRKRQ